MNRSRLLTLVSWLIAVTLAATVIVQPTSGQTQAGQGPRFERVNGKAVAARQVIVKFRERPAPEEIALEADADRDEEIGGAGARLIHSRSHDTATLLERFSRRPDVEYAEPDFVVQADQNSDDPWFSALWAMVNTGQAIQGSTGVAGADIGAWAAWDISTGSRATVVAVVDTGVDYTHPDLSANMWSAPAPFTVTIGGFTITCAAGTHGFNAITRQCDPRDDNDHGTHVAGTIGAIGNNGVGVAGVNWTASIMGLKFLDAAGTGYTSDAINAIEFAVQARAGLGAGANVRVLSNSWGGDGYSQALLDQVARANASDMLFVAAAGNSGANNDAAAYYPASYTAPNVISVAATDNRDALAPFSNYGLNSVHLAAPGVSILSTVRGTRYAYGSGTSMAAPHVSGAAALALAACSLSTAELKSTLLDTVDAVTALAGRTTTGGRLDVGSALLSCRTSVPAPDFSIAAAPASISVKRGKAVASTVTVTGQNGFDASVALAVSGLPAGVTASFAPASIASSGTSTLTLKTGAKTPRGTFALTISGTGGGLTRTATVTLKVS